jgi:hypothetical protein
MGESEKSGLFHNSSLVLLISLGLLFLATPLVESLPCARLLDTILLTFVMVSAVLAVGRRRTAVVLAIVLLVPALTARWMSHLLPGYLPLAVAPAGLLLLSGVTVGGLLCFVLRAPHVDVNVLCAGLSGYLLLGLMWMQGYMLTAQLVPAAFVSSAQPAGFSMEGFNAFYFSFVTLCTVGYGDVVPVAKVARMLVVLEAIAGLFYMAVIIARLVALYSSPNQARASDAGTGKPG